MPSPAQCRCTPLRSNRPRPVPCKGGEGYFGRAGQVHVRMRRATLHVYPVEKLDTTRCMRGYHRGLARTLRHRLGCFVVACLHAERDHDHVGCSCELACTHAAVSSSPYPQPPPPPPGKCVYDLSGLWIDDRGIGAAKITQVRCLAANRFAEPIAHCTILPLIPM